MNYDDPDYVTENAHVQRGLSFSTLEWALGTTDAANWHPLTWFSHALDCELYGLDAEGHHFTSVLIHALNVAVVFLLLTRATGRIVCSLSIAALFALHPLNVECVAWVAERKSVLSMFFFLLALGAYGWYARRPDWRRYLIMAALFVLALMAKPMAVTFPFALMLADVWPLCRVAEWTRPASAFDAPQFPVGLLVREKLPLIVLAALSSVITVVAQRPALKTISAVPFGERLENAIYSYPMYLWHAVWPVHLGVFYAPQGAHLHAAQVSPCLLFLVAVTAAAWSMRARPYLLAGWLWFLGTLVPMIGIVQVGEQGMADRYAYLPMLGIFVAVTFAIADLCAGRRILSATIAFAACAAVLVLAFLTRRQIATWKDSYTLWSHSLEITKDNYVAEDYVGFTLLQESSTSNSQSCPEAALLHFRRAVSINPQDALGYINVGFCEQAGGQLQQAVSEYKTAAAVARSPFLRSKAYTNLAAAYEQLSDLPNARAAYEKALEIFPNDRETAAHLKTLSQQPGNSMP